LDWVSKIGEKEIIVKTFNMDKHWFSLILCINGNGELYTMIIFYVKA